MIVEWAAGLGLVVALIVFDGYWTKNAWLPRAIAVGFLLAAAFGYRTPTREPGGIDSLLDEAPWLKVWFVICAVVCFGGSLVLLRSGVDILGAFGPKALIIAFAVLIGPSIFVRERRRFREKANAI